MNPSPNLSSNPLAPAAPDSNALSPFPHALKEWAIAIQALLDGQTILLMRKGGIREERGRFEVQHRRVWLYPTYEHQRPEWLKAPYAQRVNPVESGWHPTTVEIQGWADITHIFSVSEAIALEKLQPLHIWTETFATERFKWKPRSPLYLLLLRTYRLQTALTIPYSNLYKGCRSWIDLEQEIEPSFATPALSDEMYQHQIEQITSAIS